METSLIKYFNWGHLTNIDLKIDFNKNYEETYDETYMMKFISDIRNELTTLDFQCEYLDASRVFRLSPTIRRGLIKIHFIVFYLFL